MCTMNCSFEDRLHEAAHLNTIGVSSLASGDGSHALVAFKQALVILQALNSESCDAESHSMYDDMKFSSVEIASLRGPFYIYNRALLFDTSIIGNLPFATAIILMNLAHVFFACNKITTAASLYEHCIRLVPSDTTTSGAFLALAAKNNEAQIFHALGDYGKAQTALDAVGEFLERLPLSDDDSTESLVESRVVSEFTLNVLIMKKPTVAKAA